ncbi:ATP-binding cassette domain-containing protein [Mesorhizobium sp. BR1-1-9]|uniref:ATP-binding cassette domain-containing protein n=1 Tax=Mesorhizobium sp. BR1-1-9 TaxID=2876646 RepID=UPI001CD13C46|nr:ATP-binding cassette domain-containing protein [Mesorhizobium sp. BR1-1-9]MBZ9870479.1 ATP-binding cassette domain-containing protein [Mesorhizobium sp. BR1-1-9]
MTRPIGSVESVGLNKWFGAFDALQDINLVAAQGARLVICGPSGSGKSALIKCLNGLEPSRKARFVSMASN